MAALSFDDMAGTEELCDYCPIEGPKEYVSPTGYHSCDGRYCADAYDRYPDEYNGDNR